MAESTFEWDDAKNAVNIEKHGVAFTDAQRAFFDPKSRMSDIAKRKIGSSALAV